MGKLGPPSVGGMAHIDKGDMILFFFELVGLKESNKAELLGTKRALKLWERHGYGYLIVERD